jgi:hypothetical protein
MNVGAETGKEQKLLHTFVKQTNKSMQQRGKGRVEDNTRMGGEEGRMLSRKKWEIYSTVPQNPARAEPNGFLPRRSLVYLRAGNI